MRSCEERQRETEKKGGLGEGDNGDEVLKLLNPRCSHDLGDEASGACAFVCGWHHGIIDNWCGEPLALWNPCSRPLDRLILMPMFEIPSWRDKARDSPDADPTRGAATWN
jgi:hypothetical protein